MPTRTADLGIKMLPDKYYRLIDFAHFCDRHKIDPHDLAKMMILCRKAFKAGERYCNTSGDRAEKALDRARDAFEAKATEHGFTVRWPGLFPTLYKGDNHAYFPDPL